MSLQASYDRYLLLLDAIRKGQGYEEMEKTIGASRQVVQRYLGYMKRDGLYTAEMGPSGKKEKNKSRTLTAAGVKFLRDAGYDV